MKAFHLLASAMVLCKGYSIYDMNFNTGHGKMFNAKSIEKAHKKNLRNKAQKRKK